MNWSGLLRKEIRHRAEQYAKQHSIPYYLSLGTSPTVMFEPYDQGALHGNFQPSSYKSIMQHEPWAMRLQKRHQQSSALPPEKRSYAKELDSSNSSDALLMNVFCHPDTSKHRALARLFGEDRLPRLEFGTRGRVPLDNDKPDRTRIDMQIGNVFVEAKLTEPGFTAADKAKVSRYRDFNKVFDTLALPQRGDKYLHYQLIRNVLAAYAHDGEFFLLCDARRPDLLRFWWEVMRCIKPLDLRLRCNFVLWQEVAATVPDEVCEFLREKYGIVHT